MEEREREGVKRGGKKKSKRGRKSKRESESSTVETLLLQKPHQLELGGCLAQTNFPPSFRKKDICQSITFMNAPKHASCTNAGVNINPPAHRTSLSASNCTSRRW